MASWLTYFKERFPLPTYILLVGGFCLSGFLLDKKSLHGQALPLTLSFLALMVFFALLRLMDEFKDYEKDLIAHPDRPLPRGVLKTSDVKKVIYITAAFMFAGGCITRALGYPASGLIYSLMTVYLWLMFKEFYTKSWLASHPALYGTTHQLIIVLLCLFTVASRSPELLKTPLPYYFGFAILGSFFSYEVSRKLDPKAAPILKTYLQAYGPVKIIFFVTCTSVVALTFDALLGFVPFLWPFQILILLSLPLLVYKPGKFKIIENLTVLGLLAHLWVIPLIYFVRTKI